MPPILCPLCQKTLTLPDGAWGARLMCPLCHREFVATMPVAESRFQPVEQATLPPTLPSPPPLPGSTPLTFGEVAMDDRYHLAEGGPNDVSDEVVPRDLNIARKPRKKKKKIKILSLEYFLKKFRSEVYPKLLLGCVAVGILLAPVSLLFPDFVIVPLVFGSLVMAGGHSWFLYRVTSLDTLIAILCLLLPIFSFVALLMYWDDLLRPFGVVTVGLWVVVVNAIAAGIW